MLNFTFSWQALARFGEVFGSAIVAGVILHYLFLALMSHYTKAVRQSLSASLLKHCRRPIQVLFPLILMQIGTSALTFSPQVVNGIRHTLWLGIIASTAWLAVKSMSVINDEILVRYRLDVADNLSARKIYTQFRVIKAIIAVIIVVVTAAIMLMTFDSLRALGTAVLASAGITGLVVGMAAQSTLSNLIAGLQIALTEPIRLDDVVIVQGEWGRIEEITLTYVVVRIWDLRRLIVPLSNFTQAPFQNWTRVTADLLGTVFFYVDYTVPVDAVRQKLKNVLDEAPLWDKKVWGLQVTDTTDRTIELRALMSAANSSDAWDLRCFVREKLLNFLQANYPDALPRVRAEMVRQ